MRAEAALGSQETPTFERIESWKTSRRSRHGTPRKCASGLLDLDERQYQLIASLVDTLHTRVGIIRLTA